MAETIIPVSRATAVLARHSKIPADRPEQLKGPIGFLCFSMGEQEFGVDLNVVSQIVKPPPLTLVPRTPPHILGIVSIRGAVVTLIDLRQLLGLEQTPWLRSSRILIVEMDGEQVGLLVDGVTQVRRIALADLERRPSLSDGMKAEFVLFVARPAEDRHVIIVDLDAILGESLR